MRALIFESRLIKLKRLKWRYQGFTIALLVFCFLLLMLCFQLKKTEKIILAPIGEEGTSWVSETRVSPQYAASLVQYLAALRFNVTSSNAEFNMNNLLKFADPTFYDSLKMALLDETKHLKEGNIATVFYPNEITVNESLSQVNLKGQLVTIVGNTAIPAINVAYTVTYQYRYGIFTILNWTEEPTHA